MDGAQAEGGGGKGGEVLKMPLQNCLFKQPRTCYEDCNAKDWLEES